MPAGSSPHVCTDMNGHCTKPSAELSRLRDESSFVRVPACLVVCPMFVCCELVKTFAKRYDKVVQMNVQKLREKHCYQRVFFAFDQGGRFNALTYMIFTRLAEKSELLHTLTSRRLEPNSKRASLRILNIGNHLYRLQKSH